MRWRYRPLQAAAVAALAALITACAAFAPLYYRAMQQALTEITLDNASRASTRASSSPSSAAEASSFDAGPCAPVRRTSRERARRRPAPTSTRRSSATPPTSAIAPGGRPSPPAT